jgi:RNA polymerase sigma factor (sigma-70 family)
MRAGHECGRGAVSGTLLERAIGGDEDAFEELTAPHRRELELHCYRMLGSLQDAEDVLQETLIAAWRGLGEFERRASLRTWLYRIATNRCLNAIRDKGRRPPPAPDPPFAVPDATRHSDPHWLEPYPDDRLGWIADAQPGPAARYEAREAVELAFIAALQQLGDRQRAVLILRDVLGYHAEEVATMLGTSVESVKGALKRARATLASEHAAGRAGAGEGGHAGRTGQRTGEDALGPEAGRAAGRAGLTSERERELVDRFVAAFLADDVERIVELLTGEAWMTMPPATHEYQGPGLIGEFLAAIVAWRAGQTVRVVEGAANLQPALGTYREDPSTGLTTCTGVIVLGLSAEGIERMTWFLGPSYAPPLGLPAEL